MNTLHLKTNVFHLSHHSGVTGYGQHIFVQCGKILTCLTYLAIIGPPESNGWLLLSNGSYEFDWEDSEIQKSIKHNNQFLLSGCKCKTGCTTGKYGCRQKNSHCGPGCRCRNCGNLISATTTIAQAMANDDIDSESSSDESLENDLEIEIITDFNTTLEIT